MRKLIIRKRQIVTELKNRKIRGDLILFAKHALAPLGFTPAQHHILLLNELSKVARGETRQLMVFMPPGSAKSSYCSVIFPAWFMSAGYNTDYITPPPISILAASHTASLAEKFSRKVQRIVTDNSSILGYGLRSESVEAWTTNCGGE